MALLTLKNISKTYAGAEKPVIDGVSLELPAGCFVSIMGRSGSGKSTLLKIMCGLIEPDCGEVSVAGYNLAALTEKERSNFRSGVIGIVFQENNLIDGFSVEDNIFTPLYIAGKKPDTDYYKKLLALTGTEELCKRMPHELSGGQKQRVAVARALIARPEIIFADEPTGSLDSQSEAEIMELFRTVNRELGTAIVQVTHSESCAKTGNTIIRINDGKTETYDAQILIGANKTK